MGTTANTDITASNTTASKNNATAATTPAAIEVATGSSIEVIENTIKTAPVGTTVTVDMSADKTVSKDILEAAKGKDVDVVLDMGEYTWTINGTQITSDTLKDVDLTVSFETTNIPNDKLSFMVGNNQYKTISLEYSGQFGFVASLGFNVGRENVGKYVNLYYYTPAGYLEYQGSGVVDARGDTTLVFTHASDYIAVLADAEPASSETVNSPITSDKVNILPFVVMMCMAAMIFFACEASKRDAERRNR
jgi:hypothetical protein